MSQELPAFEYHPLDETVMGVQFEPLKNFGIQQLLQYWLRIREKYPTIQDQAPLAHIVEKPGISPESQIDSIKLASKLPTPRCWFLSESGNELIQVQKDRFLRNWRLLNGNEVYPRFSRLFALFFEEWEFFQSFLRDEKLEQPVVDQCEISYINFIDPEQVKGGLGGLSNVFSILREPKEQPFLPPPEVVNWEAVYSIQEGRSRLHVAASPIFRGRDLKVIINFTLTARGSPAHASNEEIKAWFSLAHEWIVRAFDELTTPTMHKIWKKQE